MALQVSVVSPERILFEGEAISVALPGKKSSFSVLANHAPLVSELTAGVIAVNTSEKEALNYIVAGGFAEIGNNKIIALVDYAILPNEVNLHKERKHLSELTSKAVRPDQAQQHFYELELTRVKIRSAEGAKNH